MFFCKKFFLSSIKLAFTFLAILSLITNILPVSAAEKKAEDVQNIKEEKKAFEKELEQEGPVKWTESLKLRDFCLSPECFELKAGLKTYSKNLEKLYKEKPNGFSIAIPYGYTLIDLGESEKAHRVWEQATKDFIANPTPAVYKAWVDAL